MFFEINVELFLAFRIFHIRKRINSSLNGNDNYINIPLKPSDIIKYSGVAYYVNQKRGNLLR